MKTIFKDLRKLDHEPVNMKESNKKTAIFLLLMGIIFMIISIFCATNLFAEVSEIFLFQGIYFILVFSGLGIFPFLSLYCLWLAAKCYQEALENI